MIPWPGLGFDHNILTLLSIVWSIQGRLRQPFTMFEPLSSTGPFGRYHRHQWPTFAIPSHELEKELLGFVLYIVSRVVFYTCVLGATWFRNVIKSDGSRVLPAPGRTFRDLILTFRSVWYLRKWCVTPWVSPLGMRMMFLYCARLST
jgi:hypothetical protein